MKITPFTPPPFEHIKEGVFPKPIPENVYTQWNKKLEREDALTTERILYDVDRIEVSGVRVTPKELPSEGVPLVFFNRGGSGGYGMMTSLQITYLMHPLAKFWDGAIVLGSNYRGNDTENALDEKLDEFGGADVADVMQLIEIGKQMPQWDGKNIFMAGWSRGGMMAALAMKQGAELTAVSTIGGAFDLMEMLKRDGMRGTYERRIGIQSEEKLMEDLRERSAICWPEKISAPIQIQHGDADAQVNVQCAETLAKQLTELGAENELILYEGGDHYLNRKREEVLATIERWFTHYKR